MMDPASGRRQENTAAVRLRAERCPPVIAIEGKELGRSDPQDAGHPQNFVGAGHDDFACATAAAHTASE